METIAEVSRRQNKKRGAALLQIQGIKKKKVIRKLSANKQDLTHDRKPFFKFYKVYHNETSVSEVFCNDLIPFAPTLQEIKAACAVHSRQYPALTLPAKASMFYGFLSPIKAMEYAKAGALKYIAKLIDEGEKSYGLLMKYRETHYEDLNINLTDKNIRKLEFGW